MHFKTSKVSRSYETYLSFDKYNMSYIVRYVCMKTQHLSTENCRNVEEIIWKKMNYIH